MKSKGNTQMVVTHWADFNYCFLNLLLKVWICKFFRKEMPHSVLVVTLRGFVKLLFTTCSTNHSFAIFGVILLLFRFAKSKCVGRLPLEYQFISGEFLWRKRIEKNPSRPTPWFIPAIVLEWTLLACLPCARRAQAAPLHFSNYFCSCSSSLKFKEWEGSSVYQDSR